MGEKMSRHKVIIFILFIAVLAGTNAYSQESMVGLQINTVAGKVAKIDPEGSSLYVQTDNGTMDFFISVESELLLGTRHMASIEIEQGDRVVIQYSTNSVGKNVIVKLVDNQSNKI
jgi:hypothetical protein